MLFYFSVDYNLKKNLKRFSSCALISNTFVHISPLTKRYFISNEYFADDTMVFLNTFVVSRIHAEGQPPRHGMHFLVC